MKIPDIEKLKSAGRNHWFFSTFAEQRRDYAHIGLAAALVNMLALGSSFFIMIVYDRIIPNDATESLVALLIGMLIVLIFDFLLKSLRAQMIDEAGNAVDRKAGSTLFHKLLNLRLAEFTAGAGRMSGLIKEFEVLREFFASATLVALVDIPFILLFLVVIASLGGWIALVPALALPIVLVTGIMIQPIIARLLDEGMDIGRTKHAVVSEMLSGLETVKTSGADKMMYERWLHSSDRHAELNIKSRRWMTLATSVAASAQQASQIGVVAFGVFLIKDGSLSMGALIACVILSGRAMAPLGNLASVLGRMNQAMNAYGKLSELMQAPDDLAGRTYVRRKVLDGGLEFRDVSFSYPDQEGRALDRLSFKLEPGQSIGVLGRIGSGKSTLLRLALGLYEPSEGNVLLDGADVRQVHPEDIQSNSGVLLQDVYLFSGSLKDNILLGREGLGDAELLQAAEISGVAEFAGASAAGYERHLREAGEGLSGGQKQSVALARAVATKPQFIFMDEPSSDLDTQSEKELVDRLKPILKDRTCMIITHRTAMLELVDYILVLDQGRTAAFGPKDKVLAQLSSAGSAAQ